MPDLHQHFSVMANVLKANSGLYAQLRTLNTSTGVSFAKCIKTGIDNPGHPMIKTVGAVAGDPESYQTFAALFDPLIKASHTGSRFLEAGHTTDLDCRKVSDATIDPSGSYAIGVCIRGQRNFTGIRMLPAISRDERCKSERLASAALEGLAGECSGSYYPLQGSRTYASKPAGMSAQELQKLKTARLLFQEPDATVVLATGSGRDWPEARGVFLAESGKLAAWVNEEDHLRLMSMELGGNLKVAFERFCRAEAGVQERLRKAGCDFAWNSKLGYLSSCPSNLGSGLRAEVTCRLPLLSQQPGFKVLCRRLGVQVHSNADHGQGAWNVMNIEQLGPSEVEQVNTVIDGCRQLISLETKLEGGEQVDLAAA